MVRNGEFHDIVEELRRTISAVLQKSFGEKRDKTDYNITSYRSGHHG